MFILSYLLKYCLASRWDFYFLYRNNDMKRGSKVEDIYNLAELCGQVFAKDLKLYLNVSQQVRARP